MIDYNKVLCPAIKEMKPSGIRKFFDIAQQLEGVISLGVGDPDFKTPWLIRQEAISTLEKGKTCYTANAGLIALREEIAKYFQRTIHTSYDPNKEIIVTVGGSEAIAKVLKDTNIMIASDEIYSELTYSGKHCSIAEIEGMRERTIVINGFSKSFAMTGWRLGFLGGPKEIVSQMLKLHQYAIMSSPTVSQYAAIVAMHSCQKDIDAMRNEYNIRRRFVVDSFNKLGLKCFAPQGAFYVFPCIKSTGMTSTDFCEKLVYTKKVAVVPGDAFGECGEGYVRVSYAYSLNHLREAIKRIGEFLEDIKNGNVQ